MSQKPNTISLTAQTCPIILASASPRRRELMCQAGYHFKVISSDTEESSTKTLPSEYVMELSGQKASAVCRTIPRDASFAVIGADTIVAYGSEILGKPKDIPDAARMLRLLSGKTHQVYTGVCIYYYNKAKDALMHHTFYEKTDVSFYEMTEEEISAYIATGDSMDKAGAYGIQSAAAIFIQKIHGDYNNVVGLPIARLYHELKSFAVLA